MIKNFNSFFYLFILVMLLFFFTIKIYQQLYRIIKQEFNIYKLNRLSNQKFSNLDSIYFLLGSIYLQKACFKQALYYFKKSTTNYRENSDISLAKIYNAIGYIYMQVQKYNLAIQYFEKSISTQPSYTIALNNLAKIYENLNNTTMAINLYRTTLRYDKKNKTAISQINRLLLNNK